MYVTSYMYQEITCFWPCHSKFDPPDNSILPGYFNYSYLVEIIICTSML